MEDLSLAGKSSWMGGKEVNSLIIENLDKMESKRKELIDSGKTHIRVGWCYGQIGFYHSSHNFSHFETVASVNSK